MKKILAILPVVLPMISFGSALTTMPANIAPFIGGYLGIGAGVIKAITWKLRQL